jgi:hypothetical protein
MENLVGRVVTFEDLRALIDAHRKAIGVTLLQLDDLAGIQGGYSSKLACGMKNYGQVSLPAVLGALGLELWVVRAGSGHGRSNVIPNTYVENYKSSRKKIASMGAAARNQKMTPEQRRRSAQAAARARWAKDKIIKKRRGPSTQKTTQLFLFQ